MLGLGSSITSSSVLETAAAATLDYTTNLIGWWDFSDASQMYVEKDAYTTNVSSDGDAIGRIKNKAETTPLGNFLRASSDLERPLYKTGGSNGKSYALFDGVNDHLLGKKDSGTDYGAVSGSAFSTAEVAQNAVSMLIVVSFTSATASGNEKIVTITGRDSGGGINQVLAQRTSSEDLQGFIFSHDDANDSVIFNDSDWVDSTALASLVFESGTNKGIAYKNGTADSNNSDTILCNNTMLFNGNALDGILIGENLNTTWGPSGFNVPASIYEILIYNEAMSDANRQTVETYLNTKYSIY